MRILGSAILVTLLVSGAFAQEMVCLKKSNGELIEYQSAGKEAVMIRNAVNQGFNESDVEAIPVTPEEREAIFDKWIREPERKKQKAKKDALAAKEAKVRAKFGNLTDKEWEDLKEVIKGK